MKQKNKLKTKSAIQSALDRLDDMGFEALQEPEKVLVTIWAMEGEVNNGGFEQFFFNSAGDLAFYGPEALRAIGADTMAELAEKANSVFGEAGPSKDLEERRELLLSLGEKYNGFLDKIDVQFFEYPDDLTSLMEKYVEEQLKE